MRARCVLLLIAFTAFSVVSVEAQDEIDSGTVNIVLANSQGIVVLTDSKQTVFNGGKPVGSKDVQKLTRLDDQSVFALAGFAGAPSFVKLDIVGMLAEFGNQLAVKQTKLSFDEKLKTISSLIRLYMDAFANKAETEQAGQNVNSFKLHIFIAGYDTDGLAKIGSMWIAASRDVVQDGKTRWQFNDETQVRPVGSPVQECRPVRFLLEYCIAGVPDVADRIMKNPEAFDQNPAIKRLLGASKRSSSALNVTDLEALARFLSAKTTEEHPEYVGPPDQVAVFRAGKIVKFDQTFPSPPPPKPIMLIMDVHNLKFGPGGALFAAENVTTIWIRDTIDGYQQLMLDGNMFVGDEIRDSSVLYSGGTTVFESNKVVNSTLQLYGLGTNREFLHFLTHNFQWSQCLPFGCDIELPLN